ncbi:MAG: aminotransferase-like domain-containing protein [Solirubrobacteraceae bacterium]
MTIDDRQRSGRRVGPGVGPGTHEVARYEGLFAARTRGMRSSAMRDMMSLTERPEVISLAGGLPETRTFPAELYAKLMSHVAASDTARALQYGPTEGLAAVVDCIVEVMAAEQTAVDPDEVLVTTGGQQVIDLVCKALVDSGDVIVAEAPTYPGAIPSFGAYEANVVQIEIDSEGMPIDELERTLDALAAEGKRPKFIYTIPNFQNPGGVTMSLPRRRRLVEVARERELLVLEDNPYGLLRYEGQPLPTLYCLDAALAGRGGASDFVIYLGTFSKILSPGVRLGWAVAPPPVLEKLNLGKQGADLCSSPVTQLFVAAYFAQHDWRGHLDSLKALYATRRDAMLAALAQHFGPDAAWTRPDGGMFIWATLPDYINTTDLLARALESEGVAFVPGRSAYLDGRGASSMRLNFAGVPEEDIAEAVRRIGRVVAEQVGLFGTLTGRPEAGAAPKAAEAGARRRTEDPDLAKVLELPKRQQRGTKRQSR